MSDIRVQHSNWSSRIGTTIVVIAFFALAAAPWWAERADLRLLAEIYAYVALASLWNLLAGYAGLVSVGQQAYVGLGAYVLFALAMLAGVHPLAAIPLAGLAAAIVAIPVAALIFRLRGHYFAIGTWVVAEVFRLLASGVTMRDIASRLGLSRKTVETHRAQVMARLGARHVPELVRLAIRLGIVSTEE